MGNATLPAISLRVAGTQRLVNALPAVPPPKEPPIVPISSAVVLNANIRLTTRTVCRAPVPRGVQIGM